MASLFTDGWPKSVSFFSLCAGAAPVSASISSATRVLIQPPLGKGDIGHVARQHTVDGDAEQPVDDEADDADGKQGDEDAVRLQQYRGLQQQEVDAGGRRQDLRGDDAHEGRRHGDAHAGDNVRRRGGNHHHKEDLQRRRTQALRGALADDRRAHHAGGGVDEHDEKRTPEDQEVLGELADAEPDHRDRDHGGRREKAQQLDDRVEQLVHHLDAAEQHAEHDRRRAADGEADPDARETDRDVAEDLARLHHRRRGLQHHERRRDEERVEHRRGEELPQRERDHQRPGEKRRSSHASSASTRLKSWPACGSVSSRGRARSTGRTCVMSARGPGDMTQMRSASTTASPMSWVTKTMVVPVRCQMSSRKPCMRRRVSASSAANGSSISSTFGSTASARAICSRWRMPPESCAGNLWRCSARSTIPRYLSMIAGHSPRGTFRTRSAKRTFSSALSHGRSAAPASWKNMTRSLPAPRTGTPSNSTSPPEARSKPARILSSVDLPQPEGPTRQTNSPGATSRSMPSSASSRRASSP